MTTIPQVAAAMQTVLTTTADTAARRTRFVQRPRKAKLTGSTFTQTLVFGWLADPDASLDSLAQTAAAVGVVLATSLIRCSIALITDGERSQRRAVGTDPHRGRGSWSVSFPVARRKCVRGVKIPAAQRCGVRVLLHRVAHLVQPHAP
jgi:hypothetical protein